jgi:hypothetical protein
MPTNHLCICLKIQLPESFASLRMTALERFPAACEAPPFRQPHPSVMRSAGSANLASLLHLSGLAVDEDDFAGFVHGGAFNP